MANNPVLKTGAAGSWDARCVATATVICDNTDSKFKMWYAGSSAFGAADIGYAESNPFVTIPDTAFLYALIEEGVDTNGDSLISYAEAEAVTELNVSGVLYRDGNISDMTGIEAFVNLDTLKCVSNQLTSLDVSNNTLLEWLECGNNQLTSLDVSNNTALGHLGCGDNQLTSLDVSNNTALGYLGCSLNQLTSLDVTNNTALWELHCRSNQLTSLDIFNNTALEWLACENNQLTGLDVSNNTALTTLRCGSNQLTSLDVSNITALGLLDISHMPTLFKVCVCCAGVYPPALWSTEGSPNVYFTVCGEETDIEESSQSELSIYPNPTHTLITIETEYPDHYSINITTLNGQQILIGEMEGTSHQIDLSSFESGVYFITIRSKDFVTTRKIVKLRDH